MNTAPIPTVEPCAEDGQPRVEACLFYVVWNSLAVDGAFSSFFDALMHPDVLLGAKIVSSCFIHEEGDYVHEC